MPFITHHLMRRQDTGLPPSLHQLILYLHYIAGTSQVHRTQRRRFLRHNNRTWRAKEQGRQTLENKRRETRGYVRSRVRTRAPASVKECQWCGYSLTRGKGRRENSNASIKLLCWFLKFWVCFSSSWWFSSKWILSVSCLEVEPVFLFY
jgi:hypothetical protein